MAWRRPGAKPLSESMMVSSLAHICVTRPQWINQNTDVFIQGRASDQALCKMSAILVRPQYGTCYLRRAFWGTVSDFIAYLSAVFADQMSWNPVSYSTAIIMTSSNGNIFHITGPFWGESTSQWWFPSQGASNTGFDAFFHLCLNVEQTIKMPLIWEAIVLIRVGVK